MTRRRPQLQKLGLKVTVTNDYSDTVPIGQVIGITPAKNLHRTQTVSLSVSKGPQMVTIPPGLDNDSPGYAKQVLESLGLVGADPQLLPRSRQLHPGDPPGPWLVRAGRLRGLDLPVLTVPARKPSPIGAHVPAAGGLIRGAVPYAQRVGAQALQLFLGNPRGWMPSRGDPAEDEAFAGRLRRGPHARLRARAVPDQSRFTDGADAGAVGRGAAARPGAIDRRRCGRSGAACRLSRRRGRPGAGAGAGTRGAPAVAGRTRRPPVRDPAADRAHPGRAGAVALAAQIEDLGPYFDALEHHPRLGVCLDTCHAYAAGHDLAAPGGSRRALNLLVKTVGRGRLGLIHANDSRDPLGSKRDRHAPIGVGTIGIEPFAEFFVHPATRGVPLVVETPGGEDQHARDIGALKRLRDSAR